MAAISAGKGRPDVSVVIPTFRRPDKTTRAIRSVLRQPGVHAEVVVVDDASPEPFVLPPDLAHEQVRVLRQPLNRGPAAARNAGVAASAGELIAFLDSDDFFLPGTLAPRLERVVQEAGDKPVLFGAAAWRWSPSESAVRAVPVEASTVEELASGCWYFPGSTAILPRETWRRVGPLDEGLRRLEDLDWGIRLALAGGRLRVLPITAAVIERSGRARYRPVALAAARLLARYGPSGERPVVPEAFRRLAAYLAIEQASSALGEGSRLTFLWQMAASLRAKPRLSLHLADWWEEARGTAADLAGIEAFAGALQTPGSVASVPPPAD